MKKKSVKIVFCPNSKGIYFAQGNLLCNNGRAVVLVHLIESQGDSMKSVKWCYDNEIVEAYRDKYNNIIYREYEKN